MNYTMTCLIAALTRSAFKNSLKTKTTTSELNENFTAETQYLYIKAPSNNVKMQSDYTLTNKMFSFLATQQTGFFLNQTE